MADMKPSEILLAARELVAAPGGWTQGYFARDAEGMEVLFNHREATCFCVVGAIQRVSKGKNLAAWAAEGFLSRAEGIPVISVSESPEVDWNDAPGRTQLEVVVALEKAALLAMSEGR